jgi:flagellar assembly factor FliW
MSEAYYFENGIYGFENIKEYTIGKLADNTIFQTMEAKEDKATGFILVPPVFIDREYSIEVNDDELEDLGIKEEKDIVVLCIVSLVKGKNQIAVNLKSPLILSMSSKKGKQIILDQSSYDTRHIVDLSGAGD